MRKSSQAALYSAVIFPGAGLWWLKHYARAGIFIIPACAALWYICAKLYDGISPVYKQLQRQSEEGLIGISNFTGIYSTLSDELHRSLAAQQSQLGFAEAILVACWLCSIASSYFVGKKHEINEGIKNINS